MINRKFTVLLFAVLFALAIMPDVSSASINPGLQALSYSRTAKVFSLEDEDDYILVYPNENLYSSVSYVKINANTEITITGTGTNRWNEEYARIKVSGYQNDYYVYLDRLIADNLTGSSRKALSSYYGLYKRVDDGRKITSYGIDPGDEVYLLANNSGWSQIMYPTGSSGVWRIAWIEESNYNKLFVSSSSGNSSNTGGDDSAAREKVVERAYEIYNYTWTTNNYILRRGQSGSVVTGTIRGVPYSLTNPLSFESYKNLSISSKNMRAGNGYEMYYGMVCASLITECICKGFSDKDLPVNHGTMFHTLSSYRDIISSVTPEIFKHPQGYWYYESEWTDFWKNIKTAQENSYPSYPAYRRLKKGDYLNNFNHVILVVENNTNTGAITYIDQTTCWDTVDNGMVGTHKGTYSYTSLSSKNYVPMYVDYPKSSAGIKIDSSNFPDYGFRTFVSSNYDSDKDGFLSTAEINNATLMIIRNRTTSIYNLTGIKNFTNLKTLWIGDSMSSYYDNYIKISNLDISGMNNLEYLKVANTSISSINLDDCTALKQIFAPHNKLYSLNVSSLPVLTELDIAYNKFSGSLSVKNSDLEKLWCNNNEITSLSVTSSKLKHLDASYNKINTLTGLRVWSTVLDSLNCSHNSLAYLDFTGKASSLSPINSYYLSFVNLGGQERVISKSDVTTSKYYSYYRYQINLGDIVGSERKGYISNLSSGSYDYRTGLVTFWSYPQTFTYNYSTGKGAMTVKIIVQ